MNEMGDNARIVGAVVALVVGLGLGYWYGNSSGYKKATADIKAAQAELIQKQAQEAAAAANPFKAVAPQTNPFEKAQKALNPF